MDPLCTASIFSYGASLGNLPGAAAIRRVVGEAQAVSI